MKLKPIGKNIVNGSTLMGFGIVAVYLGVDVISKATSNLLFKQTIGIVTILGGIWFILLGIYEFLIAIISKKFFDCPNQ